VGHALLAIRLQLHRWPGGAESRSLIDNTLGTVRRISYDLFPPGLEAFGLAHELEDLFLQAEKSGITIDQQIETGTRPSPETELALFRIVQELLSNTLRYSKATTVTFFFGEEKDHFAARYSDNGCGFDPGKVKKGLGLLNIESRVQAAGGELNMRTAPGKGFHLEMRFPRQPVN
jgi:signal transduction histidine kinase